MPCTTIYISYISSQVNGLHTGYGKLHIYNLAEQEIPEEPDGKVEEEKNAHQIFWTFWILIWTLS